MPVSLVARAVARGIANLVAEDTLQETADEIAAVLRRDARFRTGELRAGYRVRPIRAGLNGEPAFEVWNTVDYASIVHERYGNRYGEDPIAAAVAEVMGRGRL